MYRIVGNFWIFLLAGFVTASLLGGIAIWISSGSALSRFQEQALAGQSKDIAAIVEGRIMDRVNAFQFLARQPRIIGAAIGDETEAENVRDVFRNFDLYADAVHVELLDVLGDSIVAIQLAPDRGDLTEIDPARHQAEVQRILDLDGADMFTVLHTPGTSGLIYAFVPVLRENGTEGVLVGTFDIDLSEFRAIDNQLTQVSLEPIDASEFTSEDHHLSERSIARLGLNVDFVWSLESLKRERGVVVRTVAGSLLAGLGVAFLALALVGRRIILAPQKELERSRLALAESEAKARELAVIAEHSLDPININDMDGRLMWANDAYFRKWGYRPEEIVGRRPLSLLANKDHDVGEIVAAYQNRTGFTGEVVSYTRDGRAVDILLSLQPLENEHGVADRMLIISRDVSELKRREAELEDARCRAEAANHAKSNFLANMSHEIRTPMNGIIGMSELLNETNLSPEQRLCARTISDSSLSLLTIINNILDFSKIEAGREELQYARFSLQRIISEISTLLNPKAQEKNLEICVDYDDSLFTDYFGDDGRIRQILLNLIGNAIKFTENGYILIRVRPVDRGGEHGFTISVCDTGIGIPTERLQSVFKAFEQADNEETRRYDGTGLGLAITKRLVELMGGEIDVTSQVGEGSEFTVTVPLTPCEDSALDLIRPATPVEGKRVLIVDDLDVNRQMLRRRLERLGAEVVLADSGEHALDLILERFGVEGHGFDLGILDHQMPGMDGDMLLVALQGAHYNPMFPTVLLSSMEYSIETRQLRALGFSEILMKPVTRKDLCDAMDRALTMPVPEPFDSVEAPVVPEVFPIPEQDELLVEHQFKVLIADDNRTNILVLEKMLASFPVETVSYVNGEQVLDAYRNFGASMIFMDLSMPVMGGLEATRLIREYEAEAGVPTCPIVALTAKAMSHHEQECFDAGMTDYLAKPIRKSELVTLLSSFELVPGGIAIPHSKAS